MSRPAKRPNAWSPSVGDRECIAERDHQYLLMGIALDHDPMVQIYGAMANIMGGQIPRARDRILPGIGQDVELVPFGVVDLYVIDDAEIISRHSSENLV